MKCTVIKADDSEIEIEHRNIFCGYGAVSFVNKAGSICSYYDAARSEDCFFFCVHVLNSTLYGETNVGESMFPLEAYGHPNGDDNL